MLNLLQKIDINTEQWKPTQTTDTDPSLILTKVSVSDLWVSPSRTSLLVTRQSQGNTDTQIHSTAVFRHNVPTKTVHGHGMAV